MTNAGVFSDFSLKMLAKLEIKNPLDFVSDFHMEAKGRIVSDYVINMSKLGK